MIPGPGALLQRGRSEKTGERLASPGSVQCRAMANPYRMASPPSVFVIGPIGDEHAPSEAEPRQRWEAALMMLDKVIRPACQKAGIAAVAIRADDISRPGEIPEQVILLIRDSDLVIADVSGANPNVMYELALRHAVGKCTIVVGDYNNLPFDIGWIRAVKVVRTPTGYIEGRDRLAEAVKAAMDEDCDELTATRLLRAGELPLPAQVKEAGAPAEAIDSLLEPSEGRGFVDILADMEAAMPRMTGAIQAIGGVLTQIGELGQLTSSELAEAEAAGDRTMATRRALVSKLAARLAEPAVQLDENIADYARFVGVVDGGVSYLLDQMEVNPDLRKEAGDMPQSLVDMAKTTADAFSAVDSLAAVFDQTATLSRDVAGPARSLAASLRHIREVSAPIFRWAERARPLVEPKASSPERRRPAKSRKATPKRLPGVS